MKLFFNLTQNDRDEILIRSLVKYLYCGGVCKDRDSYKYDVTKLSDINKKKIISFFQKHFEEYPLIYQKRVDFELLIKIFDLIQNKEHFTELGLRKIVMIRAFINGGLTY